MKLVIHDACILIDLIEGDLLDIWPKLGLNAVTPSLVIQEITVPSQQKDIKKFQKNRNLSVQELEATELIEVIQIITTAIKYGNDGLKKLYCFHERDRLPFQNSFNPV